MRLDVRDRTAAFCEGGVWVRIDDVADEIGVDHDEAFRWAATELPAFRDHVAERATEAATEAVAEIMGEALAHRDERKG